MILSQIPFVDQKFKSLVLFCFTSLPFVVGFSRICIFPPLSAFPHFIIGKVRRVGREEARKGEKRAPNTTTTLNKTRSDEILEWVSRLNGIIGKDNNKNI